MRLVVCFLALMVSQAAASPVELAAITKQCGGRLPENDAVGDLVRAQTIGNRPATEILEVFGKKARAYLVDCTLLPVVGKPAFAKGNFGATAKVAYALTGGGCDSGMCPTVVSVKTADDKLVDALYLGRDYIATTLDRVAVFGDHDTIAARLYSSGGADVGHSDVLLELVDGKLTQVAEAFAGIAWVQVPITDTRCEAVPPGHIEVLTKGAQPVVDLVYVPYNDDDKIKAAPDWQSGGCDQTVIHQRATWNAKAKKFVPAAKLTYAVAHKICRCRPSP